MNVIWKKLTVYLMALCMILFLFALLPKGSVGKGETGPGGGDGSGQGSGSGNGAGAGTGNADGTGSGDGTGGDGKSDSKGGTSATGTDTETANSAVAEKSVNQQAADGVAGEENQDSKTDLDPGKEEIKVEDQPVADKAKGTADEDAGFEKVEELPDQQNWDPSTFKLADKKKVPQTKKTVKKPQSKTSSGSSSAGEISSKYATRNQRGSGDFAREMGATQASEDAVDKGLAWLAKVQNPDGHWNTAGTSNTYPESEFINANPAAIASLERQIAQKKGEIENLKSKYTEQRKELLKQVERKKKEQEQQRAANKVDIMSYTAEQAEKEKKESEAAIRKVEDAVKAEVETVKNEINEQIKAVNQELDLVKQELNKAKENLKKADDLLKGTGGVIKGRKLLSSNGNDIGATGLAILAFLGAGHSHKNMKSPYHENVRKALNWLVSRESDNGRFAHRNFYEQGIAAMAICEAYGMTKDKTLKDPAQKAVDCIVANIGPNGGYGYGGPGDDTHVTSFQVMGLKSGILADLHVPKETMNKLLGYYKLALKPDGTTGYDSKGQGSPESTRTAVGLFVRMFMKIKPEDPDAVKIAGILDNVGPQVGNVFQTYDGTYAMFQMGEGYWKRWNERFRDPVIRIQQPNGSWKGGQGDVVNTSMYIMSLEVYYRYLPVNRQ